MLNIFAFAVLYVELMIVDDFRFFGPEENSVSNTADKLFAKQASNAFFRLTGITNLGNDNLKCSLMVLENCSVSQHALIMFESKQ